MTYLQNKLGYEFHTKEMPEPLVNYRPFYARTHKGRKLAFLFRRWDRVMSQVSAPLASKHWIDHPFYYGERSNIGWLALAAYELGYIPLQEPSVRRSGGGSGRSDLWVMRPPHMYMYDFEAKQTELSLTAFAEEHLPTLSKKIEDLLGEATDQLKKKDKAYDAHTAVGLVFLPFYSHREADREELIQSIRNFRKAMLTKYLKQLGADFLALHIPPYSYVQRISQHYSQEPTPGIAVIGKVQWSWSK